MLPLAIASPSCAKHSCPRQLREVDLARRPAPSCGGGASVGCTARAAPLPSAGAWAAMSGAPRRGAKLLGFALQ
eukprot:10394134-Alexandrium_andersonii.AAC.1